MSKKTSLILLILILLLAAFMRLYMISDYMTFLGDEGRDALVALGILQGHFTLLGPRASAGNRSISSARGGPVRGAPRSNYAPIT